MKLLLERVEARLKEFARFLYEEKQPLDQVFIAKEPVQEPLNFSRKKDKWSRFNIGDSWPAFDSYYWLQIPIQIPAEWKGKPIELVILLSKEYTLHTPEGLAYVNGTLRHGIDRNHNTISLTSTAKANDQFEVAVRVYTGKPIHYIKSNSVPRHQLTDCSLALPNADAFTFYYSAKTLFESMKTMPSDSRLRYELLEILGECIQRIDYKHPCSTDFYRSVKQVNTFLKQSLRSIDVPPSRVKITGTGHAHIDVAWLWTLKRTREKVVQTFSNVLDLMNRFPEFHFFQSQPQLYQYVKEDNPAIFKQIVQHIKEGRWEADGGMWVEGDCNVTSGESIVRQFLYGRRFFEEELNVECSVLWLPDVFGYSWQLPQIMQQSEIPYFMTTKISWNQYNQMPYDSFRWRGLDGTEVLTHFINTPSDYWFKTYNALLTPEEIDGAWKSYHQKDINNEISVAFGHGDGGGGPTKEMLHTAQNMKNIPGFPQVQLGRVDEFYRRLEKIYDQAPIWNGELYLEYHRGTYTSQSHIKKSNREAEFSLQKAEFISTLASLNSYRYPKERFQKIWEKLLLNQFHDILPGSSIHDVYVESAKDYQWIDEETGKIIEEAGNILIQKSRKQKSKLLTLINTLGFSLSEPFTIPNPDNLRNSFQIDQNGRTIYFQPFETIAGEKRILVNGAGLNAFSAATMDITERNNCTVESLKATNRTLENDVLKVKFNAKGEITSLYDKELKREIIPPNELANVFQVFEDKPLRNDAWDIDIYYQDKMLSTGEKASITLHEKGPLRAAIKLTKNILDGKIEQYISIYRSSRRIDFDTKIEWSNKDVLLKVAFPVDIHAHAATYDIQFGNLQRPTHWNTSWDWARFETCAHKWVDLSEGNYGVTLMNTCKYGHDIRDHTIRLTLIKCAGAPDPMQDVGMHYFTYSLYPHSGDWRDARVPAKSYELNVQPLVFNGTLNHLSIEDGQSFASVDCDHVILETLKLAEKEDACIFRLFECYNQRGGINLQFNHPPKKAMECNLLERQDKPVNLTGNKIPLFIKPYQIRTFKVWF